MKTNDGPVKPYSVERQSSGMYGHFLKPPPPDTKVREEAKRRAKRSIDKGRIEANCPLCDRLTAVPTDVKCILETGLCGWCDMYAAGKVDYVMKLVPPTVTQVLEQHKRVSNALTPVEVGVLVEELKRYRNGTK